MLGLKLARFAIAGVAVAGVVMPTAPAAATKTICVGIVVDARPLGGPVSADCTKVPDGATGYDVLRAAGHTVGFRQDGLICTIDSRPADGCSATDATHFWAYFHRAPKSSTWSYSNEGATTYTPANGTTEGWVWRDGGNATPDDVPYSTICPQTASPSPAPTPKPSATRATASAATPVATTTRPSAAVHRADHHVTSAPAARKHRTTPTPATATASSAPVAISAVNSSSTDGSSGPPWGLIAGAAAVAVLGGAAAWRYRHRESD